jgi:hypothetical protein
MRTIKHRAFAAYVALNMFVAAVLFLPWILPRETISGLMGRKKVHARTNLGALLAAIGVAIIDRIYFWEPNHCAVVATDEAAARITLYGNTHLP